jgi:hypothetical protein
MKFTVNWIDCQLNIDRKLIYVYPYRQSVRPGKPGLFRVTACPRHLSVLQAIGRTLHYR